MPLRARKAIFHQENFFTLIFWLHHMACRILVPQPGIKPAPPALEMQSLNHGITMEVPRQYFWKALFCAISCTQGKDEGLEGDTCRELKPTFLAPMVSQRGTEERGQRELLELTQHCKPIIVQYKIKQSYLYYTIVYCVQ